MNLVKRAMWVAPVVALVSVWSADADACGGCFVPPDESTQVTGHRMLLSVSMEQTTLYDQIEYEGDPASFAWVLPIKGVADIGVSSDLIFNQLGFDTSVSVVPPPLDCPSSTCWDEDDSFGSTGAGGAGAPTADGGVEVIAQEVVGPFETVQLASSDPAALNEWLIGHGYNIPEEIAPIIASYVNAEFNFLAMKLVPGQGTAAMRPVRVTTAGASPALPLRMVAAGTGAVTPITLWVMGEGRYEPANFPSFTIAEDAVVWDWDSSSSNYVDLRDQAYAASSGHAWLVEAATPYSPDSFRGQILNVVDFVGPEGSGYGDGDWEQAYAEATEDLDVLFAGLTSQNVFVTRLRAELSRDALGSDLVVEAADSQESVSRVLQVTETVGTKPACPPPVDCNGSSGDTGSSGGFGSYAGPGSRGDTSSDDKGCAVSAPGTHGGAAGGLAMLMGLGLYVARRRRAAT